MIEPRKSWQMDKERALAMAPCIDLDAYFSVMVLDSPLEALVLGTLPAFTRKLEAIGPALITAMMEYGPLKMDLSPDYFYEAQTKGFVMRKTPCPMWKIDGKDGAVGYGRNFSEAVCKLLINAKVRK